MYTHGRIMRYETIFGSRLLDLRRWDGSMDDENAVVSSM
jgi:hypothetical protein